jgi:ATP-binding cassette subfamily B protein
MNFRKTCEESLVMEQHFVPWQRRLNVLFGLGSATVVGLSVYLHGTVVMSATAVVGVMLFAFDVFGPIKTLFGQSVRLTIMNSCLDRLESVFAESELPDNGGNAIPSDSDARKAERDRTRGIRGSGESAVR